MLSSRRQSVANASDLNRTRIRNALVPGAMEASVQVKVEYGPEKWINFFVLLKQISNGGYKFTDLVNDIVNRCPSLNHLNVANIRIRYQDDEGSYINLNYGDEYGFRDMWDNARAVPDRDYKRIKVKACETITGQRQQKKRHLCHICC